MREDSLKQQIKETLVLVVRLCLGQSVSLHFVEAMKRTVSVEEEYEKCFDGMRDACAGGSLSGCDVWTDRCKPRSLRQRRSALRRNMARSTSPALHDQIKRSKACLLEHPFHRAAQAPLSQYDS